MTTDRYTKVVLTVIALSLAVIAAQHVIPSAFAQKTSITRVAICDVSDPEKCAPIGWVNRAKLELFLNAR